MESKLPKIEILNKSTRTFISEVTNFDDLIAKINKNFGKNYSENYQFYYKNKDKEDILIDDSTSFEQAIAQSKDKLLRIIMIPRNNSYDLNDVMMNADTIKVFHLDGQNEYDIFLPSTTSTMASDETLDAEFCKDKDIYEGYQGESIKVKITVKNIGNCTWPIDASIYMINNKRTERVNSVGGLKALDKKTIITDIKISSKATEDYNVIFRLCYQNDIQFGPDYKLNVKIKHIIKIPQLTIKETAEKLRKIGRAHV